MYRRYIKRFFDVVLSAVAIVVLSPLLIPVMIILLLTGEHYIFYGQDRVGYKNRHFKIWKFATMLKASPKLGTGSLTVKNDPRVFPFGRFLRKTMCPGCHTSRPRWFSAEVAAGMVYHGILHEMAQGEEREIEVPEAGSARSGLSWKRPECARVPWARGRGQGAEGVERRA